MHTAALPKIFAFVFVASNLLFSQQSTTPVAPPQTNAPAQQQPANPGALTPSKEPVQQPTTKPQVRDFDKLPGQISGGMQKRVGLAWALALSPDILLLDEPTAGLDPITASEIDALIVNMQKEGNITSIVVTHDLPSARTISDCLALVRDGRILIEGSFQDLRASKDEFVVQFLNRTA